MFHEMKGLQEPVVVVGINLGWAVLQGLTFELLLVSKTPS